MPIYEYKCHSCGKTFERIEKFSDSPLETHEECGGPVERLLSAPALQFKGTGWYVTDYGRSNGSRNGSESKSESKKDATPAAKSDSSSSSSDKSSDKSSTTTSATKPT